ncbi:MAG: sulfotransferase domain-containing protein [Nitrospinota bacterium]|nr:sulfotransferase domain-containing protein [Nitrospinota bacterium]
MALPDFLGIGIQKAGTSWLHQQLYRHPQVFVPDRKEIHFFNRWYDKGKEWYAGFFPSGGSEKSYKAIGEFTPGYIFRENVPERIVEVLGTDVKFIVILRNPVDRLYSFYKMKKVQADFKGRIEEFGNLDSKTFKRGLYAVQLKNYFRFFKKENFLILIYEELFRDPESQKAHLDRLARFLDISPEGFRTIEQEKAVNQTVIPRYQSLYRGALWVRKHMLKAGADWIIPLAHKVGIRKRLFGGVQSFPPLSASDRQWLEHAYASSINELEILLGRDLNIWKPDRNG